MILAFDWFLCHWGLSISSYLYNIMPVSKSVKDKWTITSISFSVIHTKVSCPLALHWLHIRVLTSQSTSNLTLFFSIACSDKKKPKQGTPKLLVTGPLWGNIPDNKVYGANMGPTWVLSAPDGLHVGPMNLAIRDISDWCIPLKKASNVESVIISWCRWRSMQKTAVLWNYAWHCFN